MLRINGENTQKKVTREMHRVPLQKKHQRPRILTLAALTSSVVRCSIYKQCDRKRRDQCYKLATDIYGRKLQTHSLIALLDGYCTLR
jgi:hypothetical protein